MRAIGGVQHEAGALHGGGEMLGQPVGGTGFVRFTAAQLAHQVAGVDADRAALGAEAGGGAGVDAVVVVEPLDFRGIDTGALTGLDIAPDDDALARRQGQPAGWADRLAETALDTLVDDLSAAGSGLRFFRWMSGSSESTTSGLRMPVGRAGA